MGRTRRQFWITALALLAASGVAAQEGPAHEWGGRSAGSAPDGAAAPNRNASGFLLPPATPGLLEPRVRPGADEADIAEMLSAADVRAGTTFRARQVSTGGRTTHHGIPGLDAERARILLRSLTLPGWGQATVGHRHSAALFVIAEATVWGTFTAYRIQEKLRIDSSERTASLFAGVQLDGRGEDFRRIVGAFISSEEYNQLVVYRDAANFYYDDPVKYREYIAQHELRGADTWSWDSEENLRRYQGQRKDAHRAAGRANTALALAIVNRLLSAVHAARLSGRAPAPHSWKIECAPQGNGDPTAFHLGVRTRF